MMRQWKQGRPTSREAFSDPFTTGTRSVYSPGTTRIQLRYAIQLHSYSSTILKTNNTIPTRRWDFMAVSRERNVMLFWQSLIHHEW